MLHRKLKGAAVKIRDQPIHETWPVDYKEIIKILPPDVTFKG